MALGQTIKNPQLLDTLVELNDLVKLLLSDDLGAIIADLKQKTDALEKAEADSDTAHSVNAASIAVLEEETELNRQSVEALRKQREALAAETQENNKQVQKIQSLKDAVDASRKELEARTAAASDDLTQKSQNLATREQKLAARQLQVDELKKEYEGKLADLKKITG